MLIKNAVWDYVYLKSKGQKTRRKRKMQVVVLFPLPVSSAWGVTISSSSELPTQICLLQRAPHASPSSPVPLYFIYIKS